MLNLPWWTVGVGVTISTITDVEKVVKELAKKVLLPVWKSGLSMLVSIKQYN